MSKYEELHKHAKYVFDEEMSRFSRIEDKGQKFLTLISSILAIFALTGRLLFDDFMPPDSSMEVWLMVIAGLVLLGLVVSWVFAFLSLRFQGLKKAPLNDAILKFYRENELATIYYSMSKQYSNSIKYNKQLNDLKAKTIKKSYWMILAAVVFFVIFIILSVVNDFLTDKNRIQNSMTTTTRKTIMTPNSVKNRNQP